MVAEPKDLSASIVSARYKIKLSNADKELAQALEMNVNSAVFQVLREFFSPDRSTVRSATLI